VQDQAVAAQVADLGTTGVGLMMGAAEANPLGVLTIGMKVVAYQKIKAAPPEEQPRLWSAYGAMGWGAAANNLCVIAAIASGGVGAALCPAIGLVAGFGVWNSECRGTRQGHLRRPVRAGNPRCLHLELTVVPLTSFPPHLPPRNLGLPSSDSRAPGMPMTTPCSRASMTNGGACHRGHSTHSCSGCLSAAARV
jgi:hypothetical protein